MRSALDRLWVFSARELFEHRGRALASFAVVMVSSALLVAVFSIIGSIDHSVDSLSKGLAGNASLEVSGASDGGFPATVRDEVAAVPGVAAAVPLVHTTVTSPKGPVLLLGTDTRAEALRSDLQSELQKAATTLLTTPEGVLVGPNTGFRKGQRVRLQDTDVTVAAVLDSAVSAGFNGGKYVLAPLALAQRAAGETNALDSVLVIDKDGGDADSIRAGVTAVVGGRAIVTDSTAASSKSSNGVVLIRFVALSAAAMAFLVAGFLIYTAMGMAIAQRRPVISMLRTVGGKRSAIVGDMLLETAVLAAIGGAIGSVLGIFLGRAAIGRLPDLFMQSVTARVEFVLPVWAIPLAIVVSVVVCVAAAALAARQVYRVSPVEALAPVGVAAVDVVRPWARIAAGAVAIVLAAAAFVVATRPIGILANGGISTMFAAEIALGFALGSPIVRAAARTAGVFGSAGTLAGEMIRRSPNRVWAILMTVTVAVAATFAINAGNANAVESTKDSFATLQNADAWISTRPAGTFATGPQLPSDLSAKIGALPGVAHIVEGQAGYVSVGGQKAMVFGLAPGAANPLVDGISPAVLQSMLNGAGVVVSTDLARMLNLGVGDTLSMPTATGVHTTRILATVSFFSALNGAVGMGLPQMQQWFNRSGASILQVQAAPGANPDRVLAEIQRAVPAGVIAYSGAAAVQGFGDSLNQATSLDNVIWMIVILIAAVALLNMLLLAVLERRRELGVLRAMGSSARFAIAMILAEAAGIAVVGGVLGLLFGSVQQVVADYASSQAWNVDVRYAPVPISFALAVGAFLLCLLGALPPARRAARMNIIEAIGVE